MPPPWLPPPPKEPPPPKDVLPPPPLLARPVAGLDDDAPGDGDRHRGVLRDPRGGPAADLVYPRQRRVGPVGPERELPQRDGGARHSRHRRRYGRNDARRRRCGCAADFDDGGDARAF